MDDPHIRSARAVPRPTAPLSVQTDDSQMPKVPITKASAEPGSPSYRKPAPVFRPSVDRPGSQPSSGRTSPLGTTRRMTPVSAGSTPAVSALSFGESTNHNSLHQRNKLRKKRSRPRPDVAPNSQNVTSIPPVPTLKPAEAAATSPTTSNRKLQARRPLQPIPEALVLTADDLLTPVERIQEHALPTESQLSAAADLEILSEKGHKIKFGSLFEQQKTIICFIRHFWCPLCQDYMASITANADPLSLAHHDIGLSIISNGSYKMIKSYRRIFRTPFAVYTDPSLELYNAMGMTLQTLDGGAEEEKGDYVKHGLMGGIAMVVGHAAKARVPVWEKGGHIEQLGGEFILGPGLTASFAHRMINTRAHATIKDILKAAGVITTRRIRPRISQQPSNVMEQLRLSSRLEGVPIPNEDEIDCGSDVCSTRSTRSSVDKRASRFHRQLNQSDRPTSGVSLQTLDLWLVADQSIRGASVPSPQIQQSEDQENDEEEEEEEQIVIPKTPVSKRIHRKRPSTVSDILPASYVEGDSTMRSSPPSPASSISIPRTPTSTYSINSSQSRSRQRSTPGHSGPVYRKLHTPIQEYPTQNYTAKQHRPTKSAPNAAINDVSVDPDSLVIRFVDGHWRKIRATDEKDIYGSGDSRDVNDPSLTGYDNTDDFPETAFYAH